MTLKIVTLLWDANEASYDFSRCYDESWVKKLFDGFARNLTVPHQFVLFTDRKRDIGSRDVLQIIIDSPPSYGACIEPYRLDEPMILVGLDTVITGNIDHLAEYCLTANIIALPIDPFHPTTVCNGVALVPAGQRKVFESWSGENDMEWMRKQPYKVIDHLFPGHVVSYKGTAKGYGLRDARIVYFHGHEKPHELPDVGWVEEHWRVSEETAEPPKHFVSSAVQEIHALPNMAAEALGRNIEINAKRNLEWLKEVPAHDGIAVIVGGGPSLAGSIESVRRHERAGHTVFALNNAANFLFENFIIAEWQLIIDPRPENVRFLWGRYAHKYILASQCNPSLFGALEGEEVLVLHAATEGVRENIPPGTSATLVGGGVTAGLTAIAAAYTLGFREIHLYGYDSSDAEDGNAHAYPQDENDPEKKRIEVWCAGRRFRSSYAMYKQAQLFQGFAQLVAEAGAEIYVHGDGLLPTIAREMSKAQAA